MATGPSGKPRPVARMRTSSIASLRFCFFHSTQREGTEHAACREIPFHRCHGRRQGQGGAVQRGLRQGARAAAFQGTGRARGDAAQNRTRRLQHRWRAQGARRRGPGYLSGALRARQPCRAAQQGMGGGRGEGPLAERGAALYHQSQPHRAQGHLSVQIGFNLPNSGPLSEVGAMTEIAQQGEAMGFDYLTMTDHVVLPDTKVPGYPYSETGSFYEEAPTERHEQLVGMAWIAARTTRIRMVEEVVVVHDRRATL